jgi:hypothetical protein
VCSSVESVNSGLGHVKIGSHQSTTYSSFTHPGFTDSQSADDKISRKPISNTLKKEAKSMTKRIFWITALLAILALVIIACNPATPESPPAEEAEYQSNLPAVENLQEDDESEAYPEPQEQTQLEAAAADKEAYPATEILPGVGQAAGSEEAYPVPEEPVEAPAPIRRDQLEATDPATVALASGKIQLVELFAFW